MAFKLGSLHPGGEGVGKDEQPLTDLEKCFQNECTQAPIGTTVTVQNIQRIEPFDELFYAPVRVNNKFQVRGMLDSGSMACTFSEEAEARMLNENALSEPKPLSQETVLVGCGGKLS